MIKRFPAIMEGEYLKDPDLFVKNKTCLPRESLHPLIRRFHMVQHVWDKGRENPFDDKKVVFADDFMCTDPWARYLHIDLAVKHDKAGIAMSHIPRFIDRVVKSGKPDVPNKTEHVPYVVTDFCGGIRAQHGSEIDFQGIRDLVIELTNKRGFNIRLITFDQFQSVDMTQQLRNMGFIVARLSMDSTTSYARVDFDRDDGYKPVSTEGQKAAPFTAIRELIYERRWSCPFHPDLIKEMRKSEKDEITGKVQPAVRARDDIWQAVAGSVFNAVNNEDWAPVEHQEEPDSAFEDGEYYGDLTSTVTTDGYLDEGSVLESNDYLGNIV